jgi:predicted SAM-dependent methyltransferase
MRSITSYAKFQALASNLRRNRRAQLGADRVQRLDRLDLGCGLNIHPELINLDYFWRPGVDICWDITRGLPFSDGRLRGVFSEHCLEHFELAAGFEILRDCHRVLAVGGVLRVIVPDAGQYLATYAARAAGAAEPKFPFESSLDFRGKTAHLLHVNRVFYQDRTSAAGHRCMYDFELLRLILTEAGFQSVERATFRQGIDAALLVDSESRAIESLYVEAVR